MAAAGHSPACAVVDRAVFSAQQKHRDPRVPWLFILDPDSGDAGQASGETREWRRWRRADFMRILSRARPGVTVTAPDWLPSDRRPEHRA